MSIKSKGFGFSSLIYTILFLLPIATGICLYLFLPYSILINVCVAIGSFILLLFLATLLVFIFSKQRLFRSFATFTLGIYLGAILVLCGLTGIGFWAYNDLSISKIEELTGNDFNLDNETLNNYTLAQYINIVGKLASNDTYSINDLENDLAIKFPDAIYDIDITKLKSVPISEIKNNFKSVILENITVDSLKGVANDYLGGEVVDILNKLPDGIPLSGLADAMFDLTLADVMNYTIIYSVDNANKIDHLEDKNGQVVDDKIITAIADLTIKQVMGKDENLSLDDKVYSLQLKDLIDVQEGTLIEKIADYTIDELAQGSFEDELTLGEILGLYYNEIDGVWYENYDGLNYTNPAETKIESLLSLTISNLNTEEIDSTISSLKLSDVIDIQSNSSNLLQRLKDVTISNLSSEIDNLKLGEVLGLFKDEQTEIWYTDSNLTIEADGMISKFANLTVSDLNESSIKNTIDGLLLKDVIDIDNLNDSPILSALKDTTISQLSTKINDLKLGDALGLYYSDGLGAYEIGWYEDAEYSIKATNLMNNLANLKVNEIDNDSLTLIINDLTLRDVLSSDNLQNSSVLNALKDVKISELGNSIDKMKLGEMLGLYYDVTTDYWYEDASFLTEVSAVINGLSNLTLATINNDSIMNVVNNLTIEDVFGTQTTGILKNYNNNLVSEIPTLVDVSNKTFNELYDLGIIQEIPNGFGDKTLDEFINEYNKIPQS